MQFRCLFSTIQTLACSKIPGKFVYIFLIFPKKVLLFCNIFRWIGLVSLSGFFFAMQMIDRVTDHKRRLNGTRSSRLFFIVKFNIKENIIMNITLILLNLIHSLQFYIYIFILLFFLG